MTFALTWLPNVLRQANLKVAPCPDWETRGTSEMGPVFGVLCHHTAGSPIGNMPSLNVLIKGRPNLSGPLSQLGLGRDGTFYVIAAGKANHAGEGNWLGITHGNRHFIGIEAEHTGKPTDPWPEAQMNAYRRGVAAILAYKHLSPSRCAGHGEYALPPGRKIDPLFDMDEFRKAVADIMSGRTPPQQLIPAAEHGASNGGNPRPTLRRGAQGPHVLALRKLLGLAEQALFDAPTESKVRDFQRRKQLVPDGIVGPKTWGALDRG